MPTCKNWCFWKDLVTSLRSWEHQRTEKSPNSTCKLLFQRPAWLSDMFITDLTAAAAGQKNIFFKLLYQLRSFPSGCHCWNVKTGKMRRENTQSESSYWKQSDGVPKFQTENNNVRKVVEKMEMVHLSRRWWFIYSSNSYSNLTEVWTGV